MPEVIVVPGGIGGEFRHVEIAEPHRAGALNALDDRGGDAGPVVAQNLRAACRDAPFAVVHVLMGERHTVQRPQARRLAAHPVGSARRLQRLVILE